MRVTIWLQIAVNCGISHSVFCVCPLALLTSLRSKADDYLMFLLLCQQEMGCAAVLVTQLSHSSSSTRQLLGILYEVARPMLSVSKKALYYVQAAAATPWA